MSTPAPASVHRRLAAFQNQVSPSVIPDSLFPNDLTMNPLTGSQTDLANSPIPLTEEASMYSSRQIPLFNPELEKAAGITDTGITIDSIKSHAIPRLNDYIEPSSLKWYPNVFQRTKKGVQSSMEHAFSSPQSLSQNNINLDAMSMKHAPSHSMPIEAINQSINDDSLAPEKVTYNQMIHEDEVVLLDIVRRKTIAHKAKAFVRAGPRPMICWAHSEVCAAIVTCGGICPGLNDVIAELFHSLYYSYGVDRIYGIHSGFRGFHDPAYWPWSNLTPEKVRGIYEKGGSVLGSSRGGFDVDKILAACKAKGVNQIYVIGGDGTHRAANILYLETRKRGLKMTVAGIPKTIDNDIGVIDRSFGFNTAVNEARKAIQSAVIEAQCAPFGLGIVQLMGRHAGYISAHATLASRQVDICLIPEVPFPLHGELGVLQLVESLLDRQGHGVIVVAEGAGADLFKESTDRDESGNLRLPEIGKFLQHEIDKHFKKVGKTVSIKYHDPSYMIRSVPADAGDSVYCMTLAQNAVHGAMAGFTGFTSGLVNNRTVLLPIPSITATSPSYLNPEGRTWERVVSLTHQPMWEKSIKQRELLAQALKRKQQEEEKEAANA